jgi:alpha-1,6-mannosyltransferase
MKPAIGRPLVLCDMTQAYAATSGGIRTYLDMKSRYLAEHGRFIHVVIVPGERDTLTVDGVRRLYTVAAPPVPRCPPYRFMLRGDKVAAILERESPHVIEFGSPYLLPWIAFRHRRRRGAAVAGFYHTDFPSAYVGPAVRSLAPAEVARLAERAAERYAGAVYSRCDATLVASESLARKLAGVGVANLVRTSLGVDLRGFHPSRRDPELRRRLTGDGAHRLLVYAGRIDHEKRVDWLVEAFRATAPHLAARLVLAGDGPLRPALLQLAARDPRLCVLPHVADRAELARLLASCDLYVTAGPFETFGLAVAEAQASGLPVLGVRAGALVDRVPARTGRLVAVHDAAAMAEGMIELGGRELPGLREAARAHAERTLSWERCFGRLVPLYERLARGAGRYLRVPDAAAGRPRSVGHHVATIEAELSTWVDG